MKKLLLSITLLSSLTSFAQTEKEEKTPDFEFLDFRRSRFHLVDDDRHRLKSKLSKQEMSELLTDYPRALNHYSGYRAMHGLKVVTRWMFIGTELVAIPFIFGNSREFETGTDIATAGILFALAVHLPISIITGSKAGKVTENYNYQVRKEREKYSLGFGGTKNGIGLVLNF